VYEHVSHSILGADTCFTGSTHADNRASGAESLKTFSAALTQMQSTLEGIPRFWNRVRIALQPLQRQQPPLKFTADILKKAAWKDYETQMLAAQSSLRISREVVTSMTPASEGSIEYSQMDSPTYKAHHENPFRGPFSSHGGSGRTSTAERSTKGTSKTTPPSANVTQHKPNWPLRLLGFKERQESSSLQVAIVHDAAIIGYRSFMPWMNARYASDQIYIAGRSV
jgi:hypothetical protein